MNGKPKVPPAGELRQSQLITTFGPGAMVDLPDHSVVIGGLDHWSFSGERRRIFEDRLETRLRTMLALKELALYAPPVAEDGDEGRGRSGVTAFMFPAWFVAQAETSYRDGGGRVYRSRPLIHFSGLIEGKYEDRDRKRHPVVPVRFVQGCRNGHLSDLAWRTFAHGAAGACRGQLFLDEGGTGGDLGDIFVRCAGCGARRVLGLVKLDKSRVLGACRGERPWLGEAARERCRAADGAQGGAGSGEDAERNRLLVRSASNAYFAQVLSVISIPDRGARLRRAVDEHWEDDLQYEESEEDVRRLRKRRPKIAASLEGFSDEEVFGELQRRRAPPGPEASLKEVEIETLLSDAEFPDDPDYSAQVRPVTGLSPTLGARIGRLVLLHRLREVQVQIGFTRFEAVTPDIEGEIDGGLALGVQRAALALDTKWLPAIENRGEGVFIGVRPEAIRDWLARDEVKRRGEQLHAGFNAWVRARRLPPSVKPPGLPYVMLHSLAHLLITAVSLECGYSASSIRERIYAGRKGYGVLLYTGTSGSEGTLGGLVQVGQRIEQHLRAALELGRLCSSDPLCAQHRPESRDEDRYLHGAACHGCLLIAEPSCERRNELLDRALVVPTVDCAGAAFFPDAVI